jgi:ubiE/COQ5 methyltransferase family
VLSLDIRLFVLSLSTWGASEGIINRQVILKTGGFYSATSANFYLVFGNNSQPEPVQDRKSMMIHSGTVLAERFFSGNSATYERIANLSSLGLDRWWKRKIVNKIPDNPTRILDQACGTGLLTFRIAQRFPLCRIWGGSATIQASLETL